MAHLDTLRDYRFASDVEDVRGANIYSQAGEKLGTIDDVIFDNDTGHVRYAVVDTGGWLQSRKFVVPAERIEARGDASGEKGENEFVVAMTRQHIERLPAYDERLLEEDENWAKYEKSYGESTLAMPPRASETAPDQVAALRSPKGTAPEVASEKTTNYMRRRWAAFEDGLRRNRQDILAKRGRQGDQRDVA